MCKGGLHVVSVYLHDAEGLTQRNLDILQSLAGTLQAIRGPWVVAGDWNMPPNELASSGWLSLVGGVAFTPGAPTCGSAVNDYFVVAEGFREAIAGVAVVGNAGLHPHRPVRLFIRASNGAQAVRKMVAPAKIGPLAPSGCLPADACRADPVFAAAAAEARQQMERPRRDTEETDDDGCDDDDRDEIDLYAIWLASAEREMTAIRGMSQEEAAKHSGRAAGPRFVWRPAVQLGGTTFRHSSAASRAWRALAAWCGDLRRYQRPEAAADDAGGGDEGRSDGGGGNCGRRTLANTAARSYRRIASLLDTSRRRPPPSSGWNKDSDDGAIAHVAAAAMAAASSDIGLATIQEVARKRAAAEEAALAASRSSEWKRWMADGPGDGIGRHHQFTRTLHGWMASPVAATTDGQGHGDADDAGDEEEANVDRVVVQCASPSRPLGAQEVVDHEADEWAVQWAVGMDLPKVQWPSNLGRQMPRPSVAALRRALRSFAASTGLGWDGLHPHAIARLSDERLSELIDVLMQAERTGRWPASVALVSIVLLPKPEGGGRADRLVPHPGPSVDEDQARDCPAMGGQP